ncbi:MAG: hypothetical protein SFV18_06805 [Bryobacteraceae bacterium]|jgi:hypothetical protein|nr:hypothetical protein [Bryobacteraceae bacterium]
MEVAWQMLAVLGTLGALFAAVRLLGRRALSLPRRAAPGSLAAPGSIALTAQHRLHIVEFEGRRLLVATHPAGCTVVHGEDVR